jgi:hypothetical protein
VASATGWSSPIVPSAHINVLGHRAQRDPDRRHARPREALPIAIEIPKNQDSQMPANDGDLIERMAKKHSVSPTAVEVVLTALRSGGGWIAQFRHADFGGMSQWSPGMSMVGDMFNTQLKAKLDALCSDIAAHLDASGGAMARALPRTRSATVQCRDRQTGGRPDWAGREPSAHRVISGTPFFPTAADW